MFQLNLGAPFKPDFGLSGELQPGFVVSHVSLVGRASAAKDKGELSSNVSCHPERSRWESEANPPAESKDPYPLICIHNVSLKSGCPFKPDFGLSGQLPNPLASYKFF